MPVICQTMRKLLWMPATSYAAVTVTGNSAVTVIFSVSVTVPVPVTITVTVTVTGARVLMYSGDLDWQVPWTGTQYWTSQLGESLGLVSEWQPWYRPDPLNYGSQVPFWPTSATKMLHRHWEVYHEGLICMTCSGTNLNGLASHACTQACTLSTHVCWV